MPVTLDQFVRELSTSGLMTAEEVRAFLDTLPVESRPGRAEQLAQELYRHGKLTKFQAQAVYQGKTRGLVVGNYIVLDRLGKGGMGQVYKARHLKMERIVALKVLSPVAMKSSEAVKRFMREAKAVARLSHSNIVAAYDAGEFEGKHFLVTEYVEGETLAWLVRQHGALSLGRAVDYTLQAARGLEYAHSNAVIHRDIKPSNLLLDKQGTVKILDMGVARVDEFVGQAAYASAEEITTTGVIVGTPDYMPPEQSYDIRVADARSDIYSLGCTLHFLLTGQPMYPGETVLQKIIAHRDHPLPFLRDARGDVPEALDRVFQKMVAKRPQDRHRSMTEVIADIEKCIAGRHQTTSGTPPSPYALDDTVPVTQPRPAEPAPQAQPVSAVGALLDEWLVAEPAQVSEPLYSPIASIARRRRRRRFLTRAIAVAAVLISAAVTYHFLSRGAPGTLVVEMNSSGGMLQVTTPRGKLVIECPIGLGTLTLPVEPGTYRLRVTHDRTEQLTREVTVPAGGKQTVVATPSGPPPGNKK